jgi:hypothetical protein
MVMSGAHVGVFAKTTYVAVERLVQNAQKTAGVTILHART